MARILIIGALPLSLVNFRGPLIKALVAKGHQVLTAADGHDPGTAARLQELGAEYHPIRISRAGTNPCQDILTFFDLLGLVRRTRPDVVLGYTIKPVIYGGVSARLCGVREVFALIEGLGFVFMPCESLARGLCSALARAMYRVGLMCSRRVFFLNPDDRDHFVRCGYVPGHKAVLLDGIGVDLGHYTQEKLPDVSRPRFLMVARLLKDKGVREYFEAARLIRRDRGEVEFVLAGAIDDNPGSMGQDELDRLCSEGIVDHVGFVDDVRPLLRECHVYVLPSYYREGVPRSLLEAMACGRALITTDAPGCRETVKKYGDRESGSGKGGLTAGENGVLVPVRDSSALAEAMRFFLDRPERIAAMGNASRRYAEERFDVRRVNAVILREMGLGA